MSLLTHRARLVGHSLALPKTVNSKHRVGNCYMRRKDWPPSNPSCRDSDPGPQTRIFDFHQQTSPAAHRPNNHIETYRPQKGGSRSPKKVNMSVFTWSIYLFPGYGSAVSSQAHSLTNVRIPHPAIRRPYGNCPAYPPLHADIAADQSDRFEPSMVVCGT